MDATAMGAEKAPLQPLMRLESLLAALLPVTAILLASVIGTRWIMPAYVGLFLIISFLCALIIFFGEYALISTMQRISREEVSTKQLTDLLAVCQDYQAGNKTKRAILQEDKQLTTKLARAINELLDTVAQQERQQISPPGPIGASEEPLKKRLKQLVHEIVPVRDADLRQKATLADGDIGIVIDVCNYLIECFVQQIRWTRGASERVNEATREMIGRSLELVHSTEAQKKRLSVIIETGETLVAFIQRLSSILQLSVDLTLEMQDPGDTDKHPRSPRKVDSTVLAKAPSPQRNERFNEDMQQQIRLLEEALRITQENTVTAESMLGDLHTFMQHSDHAGSVVLNIAERTGTVATLAERWRVSVATFLIPEKASETLSVVNESEIETIKSSYLTQMQEDIE